MLLHNWSPLYSVTEGIRGMIKCANFDGDIRIVALNPGVSHRHGLPQLTACVYLRYDFS
jgi:hypothetical protein